MPLFRAFILVILFMLPVYRAFPQLIDFRKEFGNDYTNAEKFVRSNPWIKDTLNKYGVDPCLAISTVFPELIRYSSLRDKIETRTLKTLYIQYGTKYSDFSVGNFQMKPSFAEKLEKAYLSSQFNNDKLAVTDTADNPDSRKNRVQRLSSIHSQVKYLAMFCKLMQEKIITADMNQRVILFSAAYNHGFFKNAGDLDRLSNTNHFYTGFIPPDEKYNYSAISLFYYNEHCTSVR